MTVHPLLDLFVAGLIVFRIWRLLALDDITAPLRRRIDSDTAGRLRSSFHDGLTCPWCASIWWSYGALAIWHAGANLAWSWWLIADGLVIATVSAFAALTAAALDKAGEHG